MDLVQVLKARVDESLIANQHEMRFLADRLMREAEQVRLAGNDTEALELEARAKGLNDLAGRMGRAGM